MAQQRKIAILGAGNVGAALGRIWTQKGHEVVFGVRNPNSEKTTKALAEISDHVRAASNSEAVSSSDIVALSVPWPNVQEAIASSGNLAGKILIDCTNPLASDLKSLVLGTTTSAAEQIAAWAPQAKVVKAFNTIGAVNFGNAQFGATKADGFYCGDDSASKEIVQELIEEVDLNPVDAGPLRIARLLEPLALLWIDLALTQGQGPNHAFKLLRR